MLVSERYWQMALACHMVVSVFLLHSGSNIHAKSEKFRPPRDTFGIEIHLLKVKVLYFTLHIYSVSFKLI